MLKQSIISMAAALMCAAPVSADDAVDTEGRVIMYVRGEMTSSWGVSDAYRMTRHGDTYSITLPRLDGEFKVAGSDWRHNYGGDNKARTQHISCATTLTGQANGPNLTADNLTDVTIRFDMPADMPETTTIYISANGVEAPAQPAVAGLSGTLPVLYINVHNDDGSLNNEIIDRNLSHKNYFEGEYWLDVTNGDPDGDTGDTGSADSPLPLEIKARGNYTRKAFAKKPFKLKLAKKQSLLGLSKSKHYALLAHADDDCGYLRNFTGFNLGRRIGLPWTPWQQPVEVVINGDYRGLYFLTESIRLDSDRVNITELDDNIDDGALISGGYIVELDNYDEDNQIRFEEKSCAAGQNLDMLRITPDTPGIYSDLQRRFITEQFSAMNDLTGSCSDDLWSYIDIDDAVRYYIVEEMISHTESYHGSTYLFRDRGEGCKWHFSPLWDCGNAFNGSTTDYLYNCDPYGNTWIPSMRCNNTFNDRLAATWQWFMTNCYNGLIDDIDTYVAQISAAARADHARWSGAPRPDTDGTRDVADNSDMRQRRDHVVAHLTDKTAWLMSRWGYCDMAHPAPEPPRDTTPAAPLPPYAAPGNTSIIDIDSDNILNAEPRPEYYDMQGNRVTYLIPGVIYIRLTDNDASKVRVRQW